MAGSGTLATPTEARMMRISQLETIMLFNWGLVMSVFVCGSVSLQTVVEVSLRSDKVVTTLSSVRSKEGCVRLIVGTGDVHVRVSQLKSKSMTLNSKLTRTHCVIHVQGTRTYVKLMSRLVRPSCMPEEHKRASSLAIDFTQLTITIGTEGAT